jgi:hypothetical protein
MFATRFNDVGTPLAIFWSSRSSRTVKGGGPEIGEALIGCRAVSETRRNKKLEIRVVAAAVSDGSLLKALPIVHRGEIHREFVHRD